MRPPDDIADDLSMIQGRIEGLRNNVRAQITASGGNRAFIRGMCDVQEKLRDIEADMRGIPPCCAMDGTKCHDHQREADAEERCGL